MMARSMACLIGCTVTFTTFAATGEKVFFPSLDIDGPTGKGVTLSGLFFKPDASSEVFPAVVALHGCDGMYGRLPGREERLSARDIT